MRLKKFLFFSLLFILSLIILSAVLTITQKDTAIGQKIGLIRIEGPIIDSKNIINDLKGFVKDNSIKAIILRVDSPGGAVVPSQEIHDAVKRAKEKKKIVVSMGSVAASGGYYISAPADIIVANPGTLTGSIGVIMEIPNAKELMDKIGIKTEVIKSGKHKDMVSIFRGIGQQEKAILQSALNDVHEQFISAVSEGRDLSIDKVKELSDGRIFTGRQAQEVGLVDDLGDLQHAINKAAELVGIEGEPEIVVKRERHPLIELFTGDFIETTKYYFNKAVMKYQILY